MGIANKVVSAYLQSWNKRIKEEEKYLKCKDRVEFRQSIFREPYQSDLKFVHYYEHKDDNSGQWKTKEYWLGEVGSYYIDRLKGGE